MFFNSCRCSYDHRVGVLGVAKITMSVRILCVWGGGTCLYKCVCVCVSVLSCGIKVVFAYKYYTRTVLFSLSTKSPSGSRHQTLSSISHSTWRSSTPG